MKLGLLADLHYKPSVHDTVRDGLSDVADAFADADVDLAVVLGDIVHTTDRDTMTRDHARTVAAWLDEFPCPIRCLPGNHDAAALPPAEYWPSIYGDDPWGIDHDRSLVFLDSSVPGEKSGSVSEPQLSALSDALETMTDAIVFVHHPVHYHDISENRWFGTAPELAFCTNKDRVQERITADSVAATVNAHLHAPAHTVVDGIDHVTVDSFTKELEPEESFGAHAILERDETLRVRVARGDGRTTTIERPLDA